MLNYQRDDQLYVIGIQEKPDSTGHAQITFRTNHGEMRARVRMRRGMRQAVILLGGDRDETGFDPAFHQLDGELATRDVGSVWVDYRFPGDCAQCAIDALLACQYLDDEGVRDVMLVGWSFGASVAAAAGSVARNVRGVAAISAREATETCTRRLRAKPLLLLHGENDQLSSLDSVSRICARADVQSRLIVYPGAGHDLKEARQKVNADLVDWLVCTFDPAQVTLVNSPDATPLS